MRTPPAAAAFALLLALLSLASCSTGNHDGDPRNEATGPAAAITPSIRTTGPTPAATDPPTVAACVTAGHAGSCGPYPYSKITNANGYNTYVGNNMWGCGPDGSKKCGPQTLTASGPGSWSVTSNQRSGNTAVLSYPNTQQLFSNWTGHGWNGPGAMGDTPVSSLASLTSSYSETMPRAGTGVIGQAGWDVWLSSTTGPNEVMVWVDNVGRGSGGAKQKASATIDGQAWTLYEYGGGELIWSLGAPGTFAQQSAGTVDLVALLRWLIDHGYDSPGSKIGQIDFGWEICSTGGSAQTFTVGSYGITATAG